MTIWSTFLESDSVANSQNLSGSTDSWATNSSVKCSLSSLWDLAATTSDSQIFPISPVLKGLPACAWYEARSQTQD